MAPEPAEERKAPDEPRPDEEPREKRQPTNPEKDRTVHGDEEIVA